jgi:hypothetical protein
LTIQDRSDTSGRHCCEWLIGLLISTVFEHLPAKCPDALQVWASQLVSIFASRELCSRTQAMVVEGDLVDLTSYRYRENN